MHLSLQDGGTALMKASEAGHMECGKVLLDKGAMVSMQDKVNGVIIHCVRAMQHAPRVNEDMCTRTVSFAYMYMPCCLITESSTSLDEARCKEV